MHSYSTQNSRMDASIEYAAGVLAGGGHDRE